MASGFHDLAGFLLSFSTAAPKARFLRQLDGSVVAFVAGGLGCYMSVFLASFRWFFLSLSMFSDSRRVCNFWFWTLVGLWVFRSSCLAWQWGGWRYGQFGPCIV